MEVKCEFTLWTVAEKTYGIIDLGVRHFRAVGLQRAQKVGPAQTDGLEFELPNPTRRIC